MTSQNIDAVAKNSARTLSTLKTFLLFAAVTIWAFITGYYRMFGVFGGWDDEGYFMMTVKQFLDGDTLYSEIWTFYGPAFYVYKWVIHGLLNLPNTHDVNQFTTLVMWVLSSLIGGLVAFRMTRSALGGAAAYALFFLTLFAVGYIPAHPQELCTVLVAASLLAIPGDNKERGFIFRLILVGALLAGVILSKINIGIFLCLAFALTFVVFTAPGRLRQSALLSLMLTMAALPFVMLREHLSMQWFGLGVLIAATLIGTLLVGLMKNNRAVFSVKHCAVAAISFIATGILICLLALRSNATPAVLLDGLVLKPLKLTGVSATEGVFHQFTSVWAFVAVFAAAGIYFYSKRKPLQGEIALLLLQTVFGAATVLALLIGHYKIGLRIVEKILGWSSMTNWIYFSESVGHFVIFNFATPFLWLLIIKQIREQDFSSGFVPRTALVFTALLLTLQIYPVPGGSHMAFATFLIVIAAVVCLCDAFKGFKKLFPQPFGKPQSYVALASIAALIVIFAGIHRTYQTRELYNSRFPLNLLGTNHMRLSEDQVRDYNFLTYNIKFNCDSFVSSPGLISLYFWAEKETPTNSNFGAWKYLLDDAEQQLIVDKLKTSQNGCAVYSSNWTQWYKTWNWRERESSPLDDYILNSYTSIGTVNGYRFMRRNGATETLVYAARIIPDEQNTIEFVLPPKFSSAISRIELFDFSSQSSIADSQTNLFAISDNQGKAVNFPLTPLSDANAAPKYKLQWSNSNRAESAEAKSLILRLYDKDNRIIAHLPFPAN